MTDSISYTLRREGMLWHIYWQQKGLKGGKTIYLVGKVPDFAVDEVEKDKRGLIRQTNFDR
ncbi:hypothetical protein Goari_011567, partial [Gossypium aridum]|nr:hypothetical protein [Gossypium aridum]